jgi:propionate catabolism operon transcriptional regulator
MFGYEDGAFTNSRRGGYRGLLEQADGGVLFLDEVAEMPLAHQSKLLRVLQDKVLRPIGSDRSVRLDFKVVAATNRPLFEDVREGLFREDLYYRLNTFALELPPLRERKEDISALSVHYLTAYCRQYGLDADAQRIYEQLAPHFERYRWPGNVRELESFCERVAVALLAEASPSPTEALIKASLPELFREGSSFAAAGALKLNERSAIEHAMVMFDGDRQAVAEHLGISTTTLWRRLKAIDKE